MRQVARNQREEVARLGMRVVPLRVVTAAGQFALPFRVAVGEQHRAGFLVGFDAHAVGGKDVRRSRVGVMRRKPSASHWVQ